MFMPAFIVWACVHIHGVTCLHTVAPGNFSSEYAVKNNDEHSQVVAN